MPTKMTAQMRVGWARSNLTPLSNATNMNVRPNSLNRPLPVRKLVLDECWAAKSGKFMNSLSHPSPQRPPVLPHLPFSCYREKREIHALSKLSPKLQFLSGRWCGSQCRDLEETCRNASTVNSPHYDHRCRFFHRFGQEWKT